VKRVLLMLGILLSASLAAAEDKVGESISSEIEPWTVAPMEYVCAAEQRANMEAEDKFCVANTGYSKEYCYGTSMIRNCTRRAPKPPQG